MGLPQDRDTSQSGYYSEDSNFDSVSMTSSATSGASTRWIDEPGELLTDV